ncbi:MAG: ComF family protein [Chloroflexi bacterium]|nr:ComF family protein [Chloroflexota bacterium]
MTISSVRRQGRPFLSSVWERALDLVFPPRCVSCGAFGSFLCESCLAAAPRADPPRCPVCWMPVLSRAEGPGAAAGSCARCRRQPPAFVAARSAFVYDGAAREAVHALKYRGLSALAAAMAGPMAECLRPWNPLVEAIVPVPLAGRRRRLRGYNQSELLAREVSRPVGLPLAVRALVRRRAAPPQARAADETARRQNVAGAFAPGPEVPKGGVLLIDDVLTSGATLDACARALLDGGAGRVFALTFARED